MDRERGLRANRPSQARRGFPRLLWRKAVQKFTITLANGQVFERYGDRIADVRMAFVREKISELGGIAIAKMVPEKASEYDMLVAAVEAARARRRG